MTSSTRSYCRLLVATSLLLGSSLTGCAGYPGAGVPVSYTPQPQMPLPATTANSAAHAAPGAVAAPAGMAGGTAAAGTPLVRGQSGPAGDGAAGWGPGVQPVQFQSPAGGPVAAPAPPPVAPPPIESPFLAPQLPPAGADMFPPPTSADIDVFVQEARTGRFMFGVGVNSEAGVSGQIVVDERNFDLFRLPRNWDEVANGTAWRGGGQGFRIEAMPGDQVQRYLVSFTEPYLFSTPLSLNVSGFLYDRGFRDWSEQRLGGRIGLGYRLTPDLSASATFRGENVDIYRPRVEGVPALDEVVGENDLFSGRFTLRHDTRDVPFAPTEGHLIELSYEQVFGSFDYPRGELDYQKFFLVRERPDGSGRHTLAFNTSLGFSGTNTPIFENYFAGGFSTLRGFRFRGASPVESGVIVGGRFKFLGSLEYMFPLTADDMIKAVAFCDFGTVEQNIEFESENFRVAPGVGLRVSVPALGPAPLAFDFAFPVTRADTDDVQNFSFFVGFGR